ncbi:MAG: hypothetical protein KatS3mg119_1805 [Rhodothalassiaceae bacterium]|nr:MAG: hypothetical protein KatS3mg119_1805 [Rhodothalassiaceae bacterium]
MEAGSGRKGLVGIAGAAGALAFFRFDRQLLGLLPGWAGFAQMLGGIHPQLVNTLLAVVDVLAAAGIVALGLAATGRQASLRGAGEGLGISAPIGPALRLVLPAVLPAYVVFAVFYPVDPGVLDFGVLYLAFIGPFAEEVVFRGAGFGLLRRLAGWPFWAAAGVPAVLFGLGHADPLADPSLDSVMTFAITAAGAVVFAWLYERRGYNLWVPVLLHGLLNFAWSLFEVGGGAFAGWLPLAMQVTTVTLAIVLTLRSRPAAGPAVAAR